MTVSERTYQIVIGVLVLIILIGGWFLFAQNRPGGLAAMFEASVATSPSSGMASTSSEASEAYPMPSTSVQAAPTTMTGAGESVQVFDQVAGMSVAVQSVTLDQAGWVAVRDAGGRILGAAWFPAGTQKGVSVSLLRATVAGQRYQVLLYADDGDKAFDMHKDTLITSADGSVAGTTFTAK